jgi:hypothetical protein
MRRTESFSAFNITNEQQPGFLADDYSKFKYGSLTIARQFGYELARHFIKSFGNLLLSSPLVVIPSAFSHIPTASCAMEEFFVDQMNLFLFKNGCQPVEQAKIHRTVTYREDYGEMSAEERYNMIKGDRFHIDKSFLADKTLIFIDDIKITGTHERIIVKMLDDFEVKNDTYLLYLAQLKNPNINPRYENYLNQHFVKDLTQVDFIIKNDHFKFNTRVVKFILNSPSKECKEFLDKQTNSFIRELFYLAIGNSYWQFEEYRKNLLYLQSILSNLPDYDIQNSLADSFISATAPQN